MEYELKKKNIQKEKVKKKKNPLMIRLVILIVFISANTFAWFIYMTRVDNNVSVHVKAWDVVFQAGQNNVTNVINVDVSDIYPGMTNYTYQISALNRSEVNAVLTYKILEANILGTNYITREGRAERGETPLATDLTSSQLETSLVTDYPFTISFNLSASAIESESGNENYSINVVWPYESGDDEEDTRWGVQASDYKKSHPSNPSITLKVKLSVTQDSN